MEVIEKISTGTSNSRGPKGFFRIAFMGQIFLTPAQKQTLKLVANELGLADFYLTGGTALAAFYLKHRISDDLDFFNFGEFDKMFLEGFIKKLKADLNAKSVRFERLYDRNMCFFLIDSEELKVEFTKYPFHQLDKPLLKDGLKIDSLRDIAANKFMAMLDRFDPKDFVDLYFLLKRFNLRSIRKDAEKKFGIKVDGLFLGSELVKARRIEALPKMVKPLSLDGLKAFFASQAKKLSPEVLK